MGGHGGGLFEGLLRPVAEHLRQAFRGCLSNLWRSDWEDLDKERWAFLARMEDRVKGSDERGTLWIPLIFVRVVLVTPPERRSLLCDCESPAEFRETPQR